MLKQLAIVVWLLVGVLVFFVVGIHTAEHLGLSYDLYPHEGPHVDTPQEYKEYHSHEH